MGKATTTPEVKPQIIKAPRTLMVREVVPWFLVTIMTFAVAGCIGGWFMRSSVITENQLAITASKEAR